MVQCSETELDHYINANGIISWNTRKNGIRQRIPIFTKILTMRGKRTGGGKPKNANIFERFKEEGRGRASGDKRTSGRGPKPAGKKPFRRKEEGEGRSADSRNEGSERKYPRREGENSGRDKKPFSHGRTGNKDRATDKKYSRNAGTERGYKRRDEGEAGRDKKTFGPKRRNYRSEEKEGDKERKFGRKEGFEEKGEGYAEKRKEGRGRTYGGAEKETGRDRKPFERSRDKDSLEERESGTEKKFDRREGLAGKRERPFEEKSRNRKYQHNFNHDKEEPRAERSVKRNEGREKNENSRGFGEKTFRKREEGSGYNPEAKKKPAREEREARPRIEKKSFSKPSAASEGLIRLNKYIANAGICSRREADKLIESGAVTVNGKIISELGYKVNPADIVAYGGTPIKREKNVYVLLNKPKDYITTLDDPEGRKTVMELVKNAGRERIFPVGRLDRNTTGLLLLTNDGELTARLTHPKYEVKKVYHVHLNKTLKREDMQRIADGIELEDGFIKADAIDYVGDGSDKKEIGIELHSGKNRIVRRIFETLDYEVVRLDRVVFAGLTKKDLQRGRWRFLTEKEVSYLKMLK